jgi:Protein of unknown function (DUF2946)
MSRTSRSFPAWIAILAMALNALWPLIAQAKPVQAAALHEICTAEGLQVVPAAPEDRSSGTKLSPHCAFCSLGADRIAIAPLVQIGVAHDRGTREGAPVSLDAPQPESFSRSTAQPRAPPFRF